MKIVQHSNIFRWVGFLAYENLVGLFYVNIRKIMVSNYYMVQKNVSSQSF